MQLAHQTLQGKQVIVSIWQRVDPVGENFVSCSDVEFANHVVVPPVWTALDSKSWIAAISQPQANELVTFTLKKNGSTIANYNLSVTASNLHTWDTILASKINNDVNLNSLVAVGVLNSTTKEVIYYASQQNKDFVYLNKSVAESTASYSYTITKQNDPNPVIVAWSPIGYKLQDWLKSLQVGDKLSFSLNKNGVETDKFDLLTVANLTSLEKDVVNAINSYKFSNNQQVKAGVLTNGVVSVGANGHNSIYVYKSSDSLDIWSYVIRTTPVVPAENNCLHIDDWSTSKVYVGGNSTKYQGDLYLARWWTQGENPAAHSGADGSGKVWKKLGACNGESPAPAPEPTPEPSGSAYKEGTAYKAGDTVVGRDGRHYQCKPWPYTSWCSGAAWAYEPGFGTAWDSAWIQK